MIAQQHRGDYVQGPWPTPSGYRRGHVLVVPPTDLRPAVRLMSVVDGKWCVGVICELTGVIEWMEEATLERVPMRSEWEAGK
jgi:hypothetical protein